eukprot:TRINITY_DN63404_c0_g1_i1.p1 TRINITY_DN63404_c0_g1~~TRINITY_DN63404_c0_g1_i1.p1  ORF type:complete len:406 (-),score=101.08 TRINITY_DN63404_c0_g1_i1:79-1296(-)
MINVFHKMVFMLLMALGVVFTWRGVSKSEDLQRKIHSLPGPLPLVLQWYFLLFAVFVSLFLWGETNVFTSDYIETKMLNPALVKDLYDANGFTAEQRDELRIDGWLRWLSLSSPLVGGIAFLILAFHFLKNVFEGYSQRCNSNDELSRSCPWMVSNRQDMVLLIIMMPAVFILMSMRSTSRMWMVMRGYHTGDEAETDIALYKENFELAAICQYFTVFVFIQLCVSFLVEQKASEDMKTAIKWAGFQGAYAWCIIGSIHSVILFVLAYGGHHWDLSPEQLEKLEKGEHTIGMMASAMSLLCTYNMLVICKLDYVKKSLGNASMKFNGTKILLLLGPNQLKVLTLLITNPALSAIFSFLELSNQRVRLMHSSLLCYECLAVVIVNFVSWKESADMEKPPDYIKLDA